MEQKNIEITIHPDGNAVVEANNFHGVGCKDATRAIELAIIGPRGSADSKPKDDFWQTNSAGQTNLI